MNTNAPASMSEAAIARPRASVVLLALLLSLHFGVGLHTAWSKTVTHDEIWHLPVGLLHWRTGEFDQDVLNPPLTRLWAAIPAAVAGVKIENGVDATDIAQKFVRDHDDCQTWYFWGRALNLVCSLMTAVLVWQWASAWFGRSAGLMAAALVGTSPNIVAHSSLVTPDAGLMLGFTATLWLFVRWRDQRSWRTAVGLGVVLGLTQATKFTAILLYPLLALLLLLYRPRHDSSVNHAHTQGPVRTLLQSAAILLLSLCFWNAPFLFRGAGTPLSDYVARSSTLQTVQTLAGPLAQIPLPLPRDYIVGIDLQRAVMEQPHPIYLNGEWSVTGFPDYFLRTLEYKLPHITQLLIVPGLLTLLLGRALPGRFQKLAILLVPTIGLVTIASFSSLQLGVRYLLPVLPLLLITGSAVGLLVDRLTPGLRRTTLVALLLLIVASLRHHPHHLAYFNEWAGGPIGGRQHLLDSNLDWGQDLHLVHDFMWNHGLNEIGLVYYGTFPAGKLPIAFHISQGRTPEPGWHAVSVNFVMGRPHLLREPDGTGRPADIYEFAYFQQYEPVARLGYSIDVYYIPSVESSP